MPGTLLLDVTLADAASGEVLDSRAAAAAVDVQPPAALLYVANGAAPLASSLRAGGWTLRALQPSALDAEAGALERYAGIVLDDVPANAARAATWQSLVAAVREQGTGLPCSVASTRSRPAVIATRRSNRCCRCSRAPARQATRPASRSSWTSRAAWEPPPPAWIASASRSAR